jgi:hypothetical protein
MRVLILILSIPLLVLGQSSSENFVLTKSVIDAGGGASSSENFQQVSAFGQPTPIGIQASENFALSAGFLNPQFGVSPLSPIQELVIKENLSDINLWWETIPGAASYSVYRDTVSIFTPDISNQIGSTADTTFVDANAILLPAVQHFYIVASSSSPPAIVSSGSGGEQLRRPVSIGAQKSGSGRKGADSKN